MPEIARKALFRRFPASSLGESLRFPNPNDFNAVSKSVSLPKTPYSRRGEIDRYSSDGPMGGRTDASLQNGFRKSGFQKIYLRAKGGHVFTPSALPGRPSTLTENLSDPHRNEGGRRRKIGFFGDLRRFYPTSFLEGRSDWGFFDKIFSDSKISNQKNLI